MFYTILEQCGMQSMLRICTFFHSTTGEYSDETTVQITVLPQNQHKPKFTSPALPNTTVKVEEVRERTSRPMSL